MGAPSRNKISQPELCVINTALGRSVRLSTRPQTKSISQFLQQGPVVVATSRTEGQGWERVLPEPNWADWAQTPGPWLSWESIQQILPRGTSFGCRGRQKSGENPTATAERGTGCQRDGRNAQGCSVLPAPPQNQITVVKQLQALLGTQLGPGRAGQALLSCQGPAFPGMWRDFHPGAAGSAE